MIKKIHTLVLALVLLIPASLGAGEKSFRIEDPFGLDHGKQAVTFVEEFPKPGISLDSLGAQVNGAPAFFQRRALETYADGSVKKAEWTLWLHLATPDKQGKVAEGSSPQFDVRLTWGEGAQNPTTFPGSPLKIREEGDYLVVDTIAAEFRIPNNKLVPTAKGPQGPIAGFRAAGDKNWYGGNACIEDARPVSLKTKVLSNGPARAVVETVFADADGLEWKSELAFTAESPVVKIHDTMDFQGRWVIDLSNDMAPDTQFACPWFDWESSNQRGSHSEKPLRAWKAKDIRGGEWPDLNEFFRLDPKWHDYQYMKGPYAWYYNKADRANRPTAFAMFAWEMSKWHPTNQSRPRVFVQGDTKGVLRIVVPLIGTAHTRTLESADPADPIPREVRTSTAERSWGIGAFSAPDIPPASEFIGPATEAARAELLKKAEKQTSDARKKALAEIRKGDPKANPSEDELASKMRELGLESATSPEMKALLEPEETDIAKRASRMSAAAAEPARNASIQSLVRFAHLPLTKIKDWILTWPDVDKNVDHGIFRGLDDIVALHKEIQEGKTELARTVKTYIEDIRKTLVIDPDPKAREKEKVDKKFGKDWTTAKAMETGDPLTGTIFFFQPPSVFRPSASWIYSSGYTEGALNPTTAPRGIRAMIWDNSINNLWKKTGRTQVNRSMAAMAYIFSDPDFWNGRYYDWGIGNPNFHTDMHNIPGMVASQLNTHPHSKRWADYSKREIAADVTRSSWQPGGGWTESPGYTGHAFSVFLPTAHALRRAGIVDSFSEKTFRDAMEFNLNLITPFDKRKGVRGLMSIGDSAHDVRVENLQQGAMAYEKSDPVLASNLMAGARSAIKAGDMIKPGTLGNTLTTTNPSLPANPDWKLESRYYGGIGSFLRSRFGTPAEALVTFKAGPARNHYQGDELSFTYWGNGDYVAVDYSSFYNPRMNPEWTHNKVSFGLSASSPVAKFMAFESTPGADLSVAENVNNSLSIMSPPYASARALWDYRTIPTRPKTNRRLLLLVKHPKDSPFPDYLVVRDEIQGDTNDQLPAAPLRTGLEIVVEEMLRAYIRDASLSPSQADELFAEFERYLALFGAPPDVAKALVLEARKCVQAGREETPALAEFPALKSALDAAMPRFQFDHSPRSNIHLLARPNPKTSASLLDFDGQMDSRILLYCATGQDLANANLNGFGWGHNKRPADFPPPRGQGGKEVLLPWNGGPWHSYRHGFELGKDVALATDTQSKLPPYAFGESAQWVSVPFGKRKELTFVLYPLGKDSPVPSFESSENGDVIKVTAGGRSESITLATGKPVRIFRDGREEVIAAELPAIGGAQPTALAPKRTIDVGFDKQDDRPTFTEP